jgi:hypothetical protein
MGHASIATTQRYADYAPRHDERALVQAASAATSRVSRASKPVAQPGSTARHLDRMAAVLD